jgi:phosphatidylglycerol:prolipoprotein diacylglycerol transferase
MLIHPNFNPIALQIGPVSVHWYGLMYLAAFATFIFLANRRLSHPNFANLPKEKRWNKQDIDDMLFLGVLGVVLGGRIGYCLFYKPGYYLDHPAEILQVWKGGMSFHGGLIGVIVSQTWFAYSRKKPWRQVMDLVAPCVPLGLGFGRLGNFINGELPGRFADPSLPWAMVFNGYGNIPRHPSQIYNFLLEGLLLFIIVWWYCQKQRPLGRVAALFLMGYGSFRFIAENYREPDSFLGFLQLGMTMGQWLCVPMILAGIVLWFWPQQKSNS